MKLKREELLAQIDYWGNECRNCAEHHNYSCETGCPHQPRCEQAYQQIKEAIQSDVEHQELTANYIDIVIDLYEQLEKKKPGVTEEWIWEARAYIAEYPSYHRLEEKLKEIGVEITKK